MTSTVPDMGKRNVQIRVSQDLANDIAIVAAAMQKSVPDYAEEALRAAVAKDMVHAVRVTKERADALKKRPHQASPDEEKGRDDK
jgi:hypothetical protein